MAKRILVVGCGAREHAITLALQRSQHQPIIFCCGNAKNPGIAAYTEDYKILNMSDIEGIVAFAEQMKIDFAVIGPEAPLEKGLADALNAKQISSIGPKKNLARIETSKSYARELMRKHRIAGLPRFKNFANLDGIADFINEFGADNYVVKANGLMSGKGVKLAGDHLHSEQEALEFCREIFNLNQTVVIEEKLIGQEFSLMCFYDGKTLIPMPIVQDHKRAFVNDTGPNTGGMGSYSDANHSLPFLNENDVTAAMRINSEVITSLQADCGEKYVGILYGSFIATKNGVYVIEFNARFGDPESLNVLAILETDFVDICAAMVNTNLNQLAIHFANLATVCKYVVPKGYPDKPHKNALIDIANVKDKNKLFLAGVDTRENVLVTTGARVAACVGVGKTIAEAEQIAEQEISQINGDVFYRNDIGTNELIQKRINFMQELRQS